MARTMTAAAIFSCKAPSGGKMSWAWAPKLKGMPVRVEATQAAVAGPSAQGKRIVAGDQQPDFRPELLRVQPSGQLQYLALGAAEF